MTQLQELKERLLFETKQSNAFRFKRNDAKTEKSRKGWQILIDLADQSKDKLREQIKILESEGMKAPVKKTPVKKTAKKKSPTLKKVCSKVISRVGITSDGKLKPGYRWRRGGGSAIKVKPKAVKKPAAKKKTPAKKKK